MIKARSPFFIEHEETAAPTVLPRFTCDDTVISGLEIAANGTITNPTVSVGTLHSIEPSSFGTVTVATSRIVNVKVTYDSANFRPPTDDSDEIYCAVEYLQPATVTAAHCKTYEVENHSTDETATVRYIACDGDQLIVHTLQPSSSVTICVAAVNSTTFGYPTVLGSNVTYFDSLAGCTTDSLS